MKIFKLYSVILVERPPFICIDSRVQQTFIRQLQDSRELQGALALRDTKMYKEERNWHLLSTYNVPGICRPFNYIFSFNSQN